MHSHFVGFLVLSCHGSDAQEIANVEDHDPNDQTALSALFAQT